MYKKKRDWTKTEQEVEPLGVTGKEAANKLNK